MKKLCLLYVGVFLLLSAQAQSPWAQKEYSNWYFGEHNLLTFDIKNSTQSLQLFPKGNVWRHGAYESCSSVSDSVGNLLFATNGIYVFDANGDTMQGGNGTLLAGDEDGGNRGSSSQGAVTVKHPLNDSLYYVFTTDDAISSTTNGFNYALINIKANKGLGAVIKIQRLKRGTSLYRSTEQCAATLHANGVDIWIVTHESDTKKLLAYLLTANGILDEALPVVSEIAFPVKAKSDNERSSLAFSWDGKIACATTHLGGGNWHPSLGVQFMSFDNTTGVFSHLTGIQNVNNMLNECRDIVFSPNGNRLYLSSTTQGRISQFDISTVNDSAKISASRIDYPITNSTWTSIKLGPDGRIYIIAGGSRNIHRFNGDVEGSVLSVDKNVIVVPGSSVGFGFPSMYAPRTMNLPLSVVKEQRQDFFSLYPNPVNDQINVRINGVGAEKFYLYDLVGKQIYRNENVFTTASVDCLSIENGIYFAVILANGTIQKQKIVIQH